VPRTKMTRHQLKERDEITTSLQTFTETVVARKKEVMIGLISVAVLVLAFFGWSYYSSRRSTAAQTQLSKAINAFNDRVNFKTDKERYEKTIAEAQTAHDRYGSLPAGSIALYYIALSQEGLGDTAKAIQNLQDVSQHGDASIKSVAQFALGEVYKKHGEVQKAIDTYKQLYDGGGYSKAAVAYELAGLYEANNQLDQAKDFYQKLVTEFPDSPFRQNADDALKRLGVVPAPPASQKPS
jgi:predicted negative regulator of RcsB-dependent stress response